MSEPEKWFGTTGSFNRFNAVRAALAEAGWPHAHLTYVDMVDLPTGHIDVRVCDDSLCECPNPSSDTALRAFQVTARFDPGRLR